MKPRGFSLVETLIAAVILFTAVGLSVLSYRTSLKLTGTSERYYQAAKVITILLDEVEYRVHSGTESGQLHSGQLWGISYSWRALPKQSYLPPPRFNLEEQAEMQESFNQFTLYHVELVLSNGNWQTEYEFVKLGLK